MKIPFLDPKINLVLKFWLPPIIWMSVIFLFSSYPTAQTSKIYWEDFIVKKTAHIIEYGILAILLFRAFSNNDVDRKTSAWYAFLLAASYGITDEIHQSFTPGRQPNLRDVIFDTIGAGIAITLVWKYLPKMPMKLKHWAKKLDLL